jgi:folate-binding protein YgfZ
MQTDWQNFLLNRSAPTLGVRAARGDVILADLSHAGLIRVEGADAVGFLQGQLSTDIERLTPDVCQLSSWNNAKGRVVTLLHLFQLDDAIYLALPAALAAPVIERLSAYVLRSKVKLTDATDTLARFGVAGPGADALLAAAGLAVPAEAWGVTQHRGVEVIRLYGEVPRYTVKAKVDSLIGLWVNLESQGIRPADDDTWALAKILAGEPSVFPETSERFVAQMLDLDKLGAVDFKKGCYIGQEVIARSHYRGGVKRHLMRADCDGAAPLKPGMEIRTADGEPAAELVDARRDTAGVWQMLMVLQDDKLESELVQGDASVRVLGNPA